MYLMSMHLAKLGIGGKEEPRASESSSPPPSVGPTTLRAMFDEHFAFVWRTLRRLGVAEASLPDASQRVFWAASRRLADIRIGAERAFLFGTARRVAADFRRLRQPAAEDVTDEELIDESLPGLDDLIDQKRARELLDSLLDAMTLDLREVFILQEGEGMTLSEIAHALDIPHGTAASRLRRAREEFRRLLKGRLVQPSNPRGSR
jgi:RNA polymerase sigma-70 factor (ECF subfamily)